MALVVMIACGRSPLEHDTPASASGRATGSDGDDDGASYDGPSIPAADLGGRDEPPPDGPSPDVGSELPPPSDCPTPPALPAGPSCADPPLDQRLMFSSEAWEAVLAVDDDSVYIIENFWEPTKVFRVDKCSGESELLAAIGRNPANAIVVDDRLIWTDYDDPGHLYELPLAGGAARAIVDAAMPLGLALADQWIFFSSNDGLFRLPRAGGEVEPWLDDFHWFVNLAYDGELVFGNDDAERAVAWFDPLDASYGSMVVETYAGDVLPDCDWVFWADPYGELQRTDRASGTTTPIGASVYRFVQDATHVYASTGETQVIAVDKQTGEVIEVGDVPGDVPWRVAVDQTHVYWTSAKTGGLWVAPKP